MISTHRMTVQSWYIALDSTAIKTKEADKAIGSVLKILKAVEQKFINSSDLFVTKDLQTERQV